MLCAIFVICVASLGVPHFATLSPKRHYFWKYVLERKMCILIFSKNFLSETFLILRRMERDIISIVTRLHAMYPLILSDFSLL
jgi:hypothetical protein